MYITKTVKKNGSGDYTTIAAAFNDLIVSGNLETESFVYTIFVDDDSYNETLAGTIPNSGTINIVGSGTLWNIPSILNINGNLESSFKPNFSIENCVLITSGIYTNIINVASGFGFQLLNTSIMGDHVGIYNNGGYVRLSKVDSYALPGFNSTFIKGVGQNILEWLTVSNYATGVWLETAYISNSNFHDNSISIYANTNSTVSINESLFYNNTNDINISGGFLGITKSTFNSPIYIDNTMVQIDDSIVSSDPAISGSALAGSSISNSCVYPQPVLDGNIVETNNFYEDPKFNNTSVGDYRLKFGQTIGSKCVEYKDDSILSDDVNIILSNASLQVFDKKGLINFEKFLPYVYSQDSSIIFSDYNREYKFADFKKDYSDLYYQLIITAKFSEFNVLTYPSLEIENSIPDPFPWDWDIKSISSTKIGQYEDYIIPRSVINLENLFLTKFGNTIGSVFYKGITKNNITVYDKTNYRGVCYDADSSTATTSILWLIEGSNQTLIKQNAFTGENIEVYPLLCPVTKKKTVDISGVIYTGVDGDYYSFIKSDDPNIKILGNSETGDFQWIPTNINTKMDIRGITNYDSNLFLTAGLYPEGIINRDIVPSGNPLGMLLWYNNNDLFYNYIKSPEEVSGPKISVLDLNNKYPTDLTIYEDGSLLIADYFSTSGIYKYKLAYDYALVQSSYDNETRVLLREYYNDVDL